MAIHNIEEKGFHCPEEWGENWENVELYGINHEKLQADY